jgi:transcriptional regulator with XRE-family HTH domain
MSEDSASTSVIAQRLNHLFATVYPPERGPYTLLEVANAINEAAGAKLVSKAYLSQLRTGQRTEPSHSRMTAIADFFGVDVRYFSDHEVARHIDDQLKLLEIMRDSGVQSIALRAAGLSETSLQAVLAVIENARRLEHLDDPAEQTADGHHRDTTPA